MISNLKLIEIHYSATVEILKFSCFLVSFYLILEYSEISYFFILFFLFFLKACRDFVALNERRLEPFFAAPPKHAIRFVARSLVIAFAISVAGLMLSSGFLIYMDIEQFNSTQEYRTIINMLIPFADFVYAISPSVGALFQQLKLSDQYSIVSLVNLINISVAFVSFITCFIAFLFMCKRILTHADIQRTLRDCARAPILVAPLRYFALIAILYPAFFQII